MQTILVTITGPGKSMDLEIPGELPLRELLPELIKLCGSQSAESNEASLSWVLCTPDSSVLDANRSLIESQIMDGAILMLQDRFSLERERTRSRQFQPQPIAPSRETGGIGVYWNKEGFTKDL